MTAQVKSGQTDNKRGNAMDNEALTVNLPSSFYLELALALRRRGDARNPAEVVALAVQTWLDAHMANPGAPGYQWKTLFLPDGTELRTRYLATWYYARIEGDAVMFGGESVSPRDWMIKVTGAVRDAWNEIWIRRDINEGWRRAADLREQCAEAIADGERRRLARRFDDA